MNRFRSIWLSMPAHHGPGFDWGLWLAAIGVILAAAALAVEIYGPPRQWRRARQARKARFYVPELKRTMKDLDTAIAARDLKSIRHHLCDWRERAATVHGLLLDAKPDDDKVVENLKKSMRLARVAGAALVSDDEHAFKPCMEARNAINEAFDTLNIWVSWRHR